MPESQPMSAADLLKLGYENDALLLEDMSLCSNCSWTCTDTNAQN
ncbi:hypothetical protein [Actinophytocola sp.]